MENIDTLFNFCLIIAGSILAIWAIKATAETIIHKKRTAKKNNPNNLARKQQTLNHIANAQKAHYSK